MDRAQNLSRPAPDSVLRTLQISSKSVHFRQRYIRTREHRQSALESESNIRLKPIFDPNNNDKLLGLFYIVILYSWQFARVYCAQKRNIFKCNSWLSFSEHVASLRGCNLVRCAASAAGDATSKFRVQLLCKLSRTKLILSFPVTLHHSVGFVRRGQWSCEKQRAMRACRSD